MTKALELAKFGRETPPTGVVVGDSDAQTLSSKTFSDGPVFSGLNANGVPFLNASKVLSSSSTFVFDGTNLGIGIANPAWKLDVRGQDARLSSGSAGSYAIFRVGGAGSDSLWGYAGANNDVSTGSTAGDTVFGTNKAAANLRFLSGNGALTMTLSSSGYLGVGIASPTAIVHTQSSGLGDGGGIKIGNSGSGGGTFAIWPTATINSEGANKLIFTGSGGNLVTITGAGDVLIGTTTGQSSAGTTSKLVVSGDTPTTAGDLNLRLHDITTGTILQLMRSGSTYNYAGIGGSESAVYTTSTLNLVADGNYAIKFNNGSTPTERMRITGAGRVGIGMTTPLSYLHINTQGTTRGLTIDNSYGGGAGGTSGVSTANAINDLITLRAAYGDNPETTTNNGMKWGIHFSGYNGDTWPFNGKSAAIYATSEENSNAGYNRKVGLTFWTSSMDTDYAERFRIDNNGRVIINPNQTTNYAGMLDIYGGGGATTLGAIRIGDGTYAGGHVNYWDIGRDNNVSGDFTFALNASEKMRIQTNGNVAIGDTTASGYKLKVAGTTNVTGALVVGSYASVGSIVANDPGASYYSYNNRIGGGLAVTGTTFIAGTFLQSALASYPQQTLTLGVGTTTWVKLFTITSPGGCRVRYNCGSNNSEEQGEFSIKGTYVASGTQLSWTRQTYYHNLNEIRVTGSNSTPYTVWALVRTSDFGPFFNFQVFEAINSVTLHNSTGETPGTAVASITNPHYSSTNFNHVVSITGSPLYIAGVPASSLYAVNIKNTNMTDNSSGFDYILNGSSGGGTTWNIVKDSIINLYDSSGGHYGTWGRQVYLEAGYWRIKGAARLSSTNGSIHGNTAASNYQYNISFRFVISGGPDTGSLRWSTDSLGDGTRVAFSSDASYKAAGLHTITFNTSGYDGVKQIYITDLYLERVA